MDLGPSQPPVGQSNSIPDRVSGPEESENNCHGRSQQFVFLDIFLVVFFLVTNIDPPSLDS